METARTVEALRAHIRRWRDAGERIALVPTMGALHAGHLSLLQLGRRHATRLVATIFVNPKQFAAHEDLDRYPRTEARDAEQLAAAGCDLLFLPGVEQVYPPGHATLVRVAGLDQPMEGNSRPGHFDGVATVVTKLLLMALPDVALFGEKDWQQLAIIRRLAKDLDIPCEIVGAPTVREADGLAMSSRNAYLSASERGAAPALFRALAGAVQALLQGQPVAQALDTARAAIEAAGFRPDYLLLADERTLLPLDALRPGARLFAAARLGSTRLIDNLAVEAGEEPA